jgi:NADPH:quinone reductase-like Zn-dependent oxidoreductase
VCSGANVDLVRSLGAEPVIDYTTEDFRSRSERYDVVLNAVGKRKVQLEPAAALAPNGRHVTVDDGLAGLRKDDMLILNEAFEAGKLRAVIDRRYRLEEIVEAHRYVDAGHKKGNVVLVIAEGWIRPD